MILSFFFSAVHSREEELSTPFLIPSHYGGQVIFPMPCGNLIYIHLKDKQKIRHRKRWSQVRNCLLQNKMPLKYDKIELTVIDVMILHIYTKLIVAKPLVDERRRFIIV